MKYNNYYNTVPKAQFGLSNPFGDLFGTWMGRWYGGDYFSDRGESITGMQHPGDWLKYTINRNNSIADRYTQNKKDLNTPYYDGAWGDDAINFYYNQYSGLDPREAQAYSDAYNLSKEFQKTHSQGYGFDPLGTKAKDAQKEYDASMNDLIGNYTGFSQWVSGRQGYRDQAGKDYDADQARITKAKKDQPLLNQQMGYAALDTFEGVKSGLDYLGSYTPEEKIGNGLRGSKGLMTAQYGKYTQNGYRPHSEDVNNRVNYVFGPTISMEGMTHPLFVLSKFKNSSKNKKQSPFAILDYVKEDEKEHTVLGAYERVEFKNPKANNTNVENILAMMNSGDSNGQKVADKSIEKNANTNFENKTKMAKHGNLIQALNNYEALKRLRQAQYGGYGYLPRYQMGGMPPMEDPQLGPGMGGEDQEQLAAMMAMQQQGGGMYPGMYPGAEGGQGGLKNFLEPGVVYELNGMLIRNNGQSIDISQDGQNWIDAAEELGEEYPQFVNEIANAAQSGDLQPIEGGDNMGGMDPGMSEEAPMGMRFGGRTSQHSSKKTAKPKKGYFED